MSYLASVILQNTVLGTQVLMVAIGLYVVYAASRIMHLAIGAIGAAAAYGLYWGIIEGWPLGAAILFGFGVALFLGFLSARVLEIFAVRGESLMGLLVSFACGIVIESLIAIGFGTDGKSFTASILPVVEWGGVGLDLPGVVTIGVGVFTALVVWGLAHFTKAGRLLRSVSENAPLAASLGINSKTIRLLAHSVAALIGGAVIILSGWHTALTPLMGFQFVVAAFIAFLVGGVSDVRGTIIASYLLTIVPGLIIGFSENLSENWRLVFVFGIAAIVLAIRPHGIFSKRVREA
jgi:branched-subunit amino acid ABC-type transport system permease component